MSTLHAITYNTHTDDNIHSMSSTGVYTAESEIMCHNQVSA